MSHFHSLVKVQASVSCSLMRASFLVWLFAPLACAFLPPPRRPIPTRLHATTKEPKWAQPVNEFVERFESGKAAVVGALAGSVAMTLPSLAVHIDSIPQWEFNVDQSALMCATFAVVYRYAVRTDGNPQLKQGVVGAFVITRTLGAVRVSPGCSAIPLSCGEPLSYFDWAMLGQPSLGRSLSVQKTSASAYVIDASTASTSSGGGVLSSARGAKTSW